MWTGLTLTQAEPRRPASYGAESSLTTTPSWPSARAADEPLGLLGGVGDQPAGPGAPRAPALERGPALGGRQVEQVACRRGAAGRRSTASRVRSAGGLGGAGRGLLERPRPAVHVERERLAVEHHAPAGRPRTTSTTSGSRWVMSSRLRVAISTSSPRGAPGSGCRRAWRPPPRTRPALARPGDRRRRRRGAIGWTGAPDAEGRSRRGPQVRRRPPRRRTSPRRPASPLVVRQPGEPRRPGRSRP